MEAHNTKELHQLIERERELFRKIVEARTEVPITEEEFQMQAKSYLSDEEYEELCKLEKWKII